MQNIQKIWDEIPNNSIKRLTEDKRGSVYRVKIEDCAFNVVYTKAGGIRGADMHPNKQYDFILKGALEIWLKKGNKTIKIKKVRNELIVIPPRVPHLFKSLNNSVIIEWWDGRFKQRFFPAFRKAIEKAFKKDFAKT